MATLPLAGRSKLAAALVVAISVGFGACMDEHRPTITEPALRPLGGSNSAVVASASRMYTTDADFDLGDRINLNHDAPDSDQLQLNKNSGTFPFIWISMSMRCTIAKVNTQTGVILGEYRTVADNAGCYESSRTTVGIDGSVWVGHRGPGGVTHVGLAELNQCLDRNGNGTIETSTGYGDVKPWASSAVSTAEDECILHHLTPATLGLTGFSDSRHMSIDANNKLWVGDRNGGSRFVKVNGLTGAVESPVRDHACGGYGGLIDKNGVIWSATSGGAVLRWDPNAADQAGVNPICIPINNYGLAIDKGGNVWVSTLGEGRVRKLSPSGAVLGTFPQGTAYAQGLAVSSDANGDEHVWISSSLFGGTVVNHLLADGTFVGQVAGTGVGSTGISVDADGKVWSANRESHSATRIDPNAGPTGADGITKVGAVDHTVNFPAGPNGRPAPFPYNYSDMTGAQLFSSTAPQGSWTVVQDGGAPGAEWNKVTWNSEAQGALNGGVIEVDVRTAETEAALGAEAFASVASGTEFTKTGRYIQVRVTIKAAPDGTSPVLSDIRIEGGDKEPPQLSVTAAPGSLWPPNHKYHTISVTVTSHDNRGVVSVAGYAVSDQPDDAQGNGDGNTTGDVKVTPAGGGAALLSSNASPQVPFNQGDTLELRAERAAGSGGRTYSIVLTATDAAGNSTTTTTTVTVPHDQGK